MTHEPCWKCGSTYTSIGYSYRWIGLCGSCTDDLSEGLQKISKAALGFGIYILCWIFAKNPIFSSPGPDVLRYAVLILVCTLLTGIILFVLWAAKEICRWTIQKIYDFYSDGWFNFFPFVWSKVRKLSDLAASKIADQLNAIAQRKLEQEKQRLLNIEVQSLSPAEYDNMLTEQYIQKNWPEEAFKQGYSIRREK